MKTMNVLKTTNNIALFMAAMIFASCGALNKAAVDRNSAQIRKLTASDGQGDDRFGSSVAIYGNTAIVGAVGDDIGSGAGQGSAYIFEKNQKGDGNWREVRRLIASDGAKKDLFGYSVAIYGDTVIVGAINSKAGSDEQGAVYICERNKGGAGAWGQVKRLTATYCSARARFGCSVAIHADTVIAGADANTNGGRDFQGSAYIFERNKGGADNWSEVTKLIASDD